MLTQPKSKQTPFDVRSPAPTRASMYLYLNYPETHAHFVLVVEMHQLSFQNHPLKQSSYAEYYAQLNALAALALDPPWPLKSGIFYLS